MSRVFNVLVALLVLLAIYFACREKFRKRREVDKMNIADL